MIEIVDSEKIVVYLATTIELLEIEPEIEK